LNASHNGHDGVLIDSGVQAVNGNATMTLNNATVNMNAGSGFKVSGQSGTCNLAGTGNGNATVTLNGFTATGNTESGLETTEDLARVSGVGNGSFTALNLNILDNLMSGLYVKDDIVETANGNVTFIIGGLLNDNAHYGLFVGDRIDELNGPGTSTKNGGALTVTGNGIQDILITNP
jgi:hypothetical protein